MDMPRHMSRELKEWILKKSYSLFFGRKMVMLNDLNQLLAKNRAVTYTDPLTGTPAALDQPGGGPMADEEMHLGDVTTHNHYHGKQPQNGNKLAKAALLGAGLLAAGGIGATVTGMIYDRMAKPGGADADTKYELRLLNGKAEDND